MSRAATPTATSADEPVTEAQLERHRKELTAYCYRMLGSAFEAEDAVQETLVRAWRGLDRFEGRSSLRSWLYRIATNVCLTMLSGSSRRARPMDLSSPTPTASAVLGPPLPETAWVEPMPDSRMLSATDPAERAEARESVRLALIAALQHLAPRQRAVLILREVLAWKASEVAELLGTSVASVNSALQRARATIATTGLNAAGDAALAPGDAVSAEALSTEEKDLLARYLDAFERYDLDSLTTLLHEDATLSMPPYDLWVRGADDVCAWMLGPGHGCRGSRLIPTSANGLPAFGQYRPDPDGGHTPWALQVIETAEGRITGINSFLDTERFFPLFGLPPHLPDAQDAQDAPTD
ncbi:sigma-70 family RNA polymerase sigma factor [Streptomyces avicenniae]|uniref:sigma-70 family RNA polymerase sigma factor n=1 Tax=Streptomyces avicenniae TaxID=500153 RepID=UPI00069B6F0A|nr:sigma-70 family RNA polymerase sigma factor [Streptomyces avicenniae]